MKLVLVLPCLVALSACGLSADQIAAQKNASAAERALQEAQYYVTEGKEAVSRESSDPGSVRFRNLRLKSATLCGEYSEKNASGVPAGFEKFMHWASNVIRYSDHVKQRELLKSGGYSDAEIEKLGTDFEKSWNECQKAGTPVR